MKLKKTPSKSKTRKNVGSDGLFGVNADLPEGIFGIIDDVSPLLVPERLHPTPWEIDAEKRSDARRAERKKKKKQRKTKPNEQPVPPSRPQPQLRGRDRIEAQIKFPGPEINKENYSDQVPDLEYENAIKVPEDLLLQITRKSDRRTRDLSRMMMAHTMPSLMALEASQSYVTAALRDGLNIEVEMDTAIFEAVKNLTNLDMLFYFLKRSKMPLSFRKQFLKTVVAETAKNTVADMHQAAKNKNRERALADVQSLITRGYSSTLQRQDRMRSRTEQAPQQDEGMFGVTDENRSDIGRSRGMSSPKRRSV